MQKGGRDGRQTSISLRRDLGEELDEGEAALIVIGESKIDEQIEQATKRAKKVIEKQIDADADELKREVEAAGAAGS